MTRKKLEKIWSQVPPDYYEKGIEKNPFQRFWHNRKWMIIKEMIEGASTRVLDIGCASGWLTAKVAQIFSEAEVTGLDISSKMIKYAKTKHPKIVFICADAHKLPFPNESFDLIICAETLEHVINPLGVLTEIRRCLSQSGQVIISMDTGNMLFNLVWFFWTRTKGKVWQGAHLHKFDINQLKRLFRKADFKIKKQRISHLGMAITFQLRRA